MTAWITADELKSYPLPVTVAQWEKVTDPKLATVIDYAQTAVEDYLDRRVLAANYTETHKGKAPAWGYGNEGAGWRGGSLRWSGVGPGNILILNEYPIISVSAVQSANAYGGITAYDPSQFIVWTDDKGYIEFVNIYRYAFWGDDYWTVSYRAGYETVPGPLKHAVMLQAVAMLQPIFRGGSNFNQTDLIPSANEMIVDLCEKYKRKRIG